MVAIVLACLLAGVAFAAVLPVSAARGPDWPVSRTKLRLIGLVALGVGILAGEGPSGAALPALAAAVWWAVAALNRRRRDRLRRRRAADRVLEGCGVLADELRAGQPPGVALELAARTCPELEPAFRAHQLGADVPTALRHPEAGDLWLVAAAWQVAQRSGEGLADALTRVNEGLRADRSTRRVVESELASARATARLLVALPGLALLAAVGAGASPVVFLLFTPAGQACLALGLVLALAGLWWIEAIAADVERGA